MVGSTLWLPNCSPEARDGLCVDYLVTEMVLFDGRSNKERVCVLLSDGAGLDFEALVVVPHIVFNWVFGYKVLALCGSNLSARFFSD